MQKKLNLIVLLVVSMLIGACASSTTDPNQGGLFSYNPDAYEARIQQREAKLAAIEAQQAREREENEALKQAVGDKVVTVAEQQEQLRNMQSDVARMKTRLEQTSSTDATKSAEINKLKMRAAELEKGMNSNANTQNIEARKAYLEKLRQEYASLQKDMDALLMEQ